MVIFGFFKRIFFMDSGAFRCPFIIISVAVLGCWWVSLSVDGEKLKENYVEATIRACAVYVAGTRMLELTERRIVFPIVCLAFSPT